jgi:hypothetical protein
VSQEERKTFAQEKWDALNDWSAALMADKKRFAMH